MRRFGERFASESQLLLPMFAGANGVGYLPLLTLPWLMGSLVRDFGYSDTAAGALATLEVGAIAATTVLVGLCVRHLNRRMLAVTGAFLVALCSVALPSTESLQSTAVLLVLTGIGCGLCSATGYSLLGAAQDPARMTANLWIWTVAWQTLIWFVTPLAVEHWHTAGLSAVIAVSCIAFMPLLFKTPLTKTAAAPEKDSRQAPSERLAVKGVLLLLVCTLVYWLRDSVIWSLAERRGLQIGVTQYALALTLVGASILGIAGPLAANFLGLRWGRTRTVIAGLLVLGMVMQTIASATSPIFYQLGYLFWSATAMFAWTYLMECAAVMDTSGRVAALCGSTMYIASACGPLLGGILMESANSLVLPGVVLLFTAITILAITPVLRRLPSGRSA